MFPVLAEMEIDVIELRFTPCRMNNRSREVPVSPLRLAILAEGPFGIGRADIEDPSGLENSKRLCEEVPCFRVEFEMFEHVLAIDMGRARIRKRPRFSQVELEVGRRVEKIDTHPSWFWVWSGTKIESKWHMIRKSSDLLE